MGQSLAHRRSWERDGGARPQTARRQGREARVGMSVGPDYLGLVDLSLIFLYFILRATGNYGWILSRGRKVGFAFSKLTLAGRWKNG